MWAVSPPALPFLCASRCAGVCLSCTSPVGSTLLPSWLCIRLVSQHVANPTPSPLSYLLLYRSLLCLSPDLLIVYSSRPSNLQDVPQALIDEQLQLLLQSSGQPSSFRTIQKHSLHIWSKDSPLGLSCQCCRPPYWPQHPKCLPCLPNICFRYI